MSIKYTIHVEGDLLRVKATGKDDSLENVKAYGAAIVAAGVSCNSKRIFCDETELDYGLRTSETFESAQYIAEQAPSVARVAIVCKPEQMPAATFWETVAVNRGLQVRVFADLEAAEAWIQLVAKHLR